MTYEIESPTAKKVKIKPPTKSEWIEEAKLWGIKECPKCKWPHPQVSICTTCGHDYE